MEVFVLWFSVILKNIFWKRVSNFINRSEHRGLPWTVRETKINHVDTKTPIITTSNEKIHPNRLFLFYYQFYFLNILDPKNNLVIYPKKSFPERAASSNNSQKFSKILKNSHKLLKFSKIMKISQKLLKIFSKFSQNFYLKNCLEIH